MDAVRGRLTARALGAGSGRLGQDGDEIRSDLEIAQAEIGVGEEELREIHDCNADRPCKSRGMPSW